ncbi:MAG: extracellular solute-binding protein [Oscillospiraceae bacterium]|nr:extracellular solute-binding protein [Oscillospiraceae bacterium]MBQ4316551.1 extracellular solute-binding protein [Oscillospiraceae bacterium]
MKRFIAISLALVMVLALCACGGRVTGDVSYDIPEGKQIPDDAVLNVTIASHASWPYDPSWKVWQYINENIGGKINVNAIPASEFATKFTTIMASPESLPDLVGFQNKPSTFSDYCEQGAFVALDDYAEFLPDYNAFWDGLPEEDQWMRNTRKTANGKIYYSPVFGMERYTNLRTWLYRKDVFDKHGLEVPETTEDLYNVSKKLKELYPESYPFSVRQGLANINVIGSTWKPNFRYNAYYDFENEKWSYGATEDVMLEIVEFFNKMVSEKLVPADFFTINTSLWQELVSTDRGFIMPEYQIRIDFFNNIARVKNPEFNLTAMTPPRAENGMGINMNNKYNNDPTGYAVCNTGDEGGIANAMRYLNWFYTDEGSELLSWGKEGETYEVVNGRKQYIFPDGYSGTAQTLYGFKTLGTYTRIDPESIDASISDEQAATTDFIISNIYPHLDPTLYLEFSSEDAAMRADYETSLKTFVEENLQKFIIGQRPISEWDAFRKELSELPVAELMALYEEVYSKIK